MGKYLTVILIIINLYSAWGQDNIILSLKNIPQSKSINPAFISEKKIYFSIPMLGSVNFNVINDGFSWNDIITKKIEENKKKLIIDVEKVADKLRKENLLNINSNIQLFSCGLRKDNHFFSFQFNTRANISVKYPKTITDLRYGNWDVEKKTPINHSISNINSKGLVFSELAFGYARRINEKLDLGVNFKYIIGHESFKTERFVAKINTNEDISIDLDVDAKILSSLPLDIVHDDNGYIDEVSFDNKAKLFRNMMKNNGFAFDFGFFYKPFSKVNIAVSVNDLGKIFWNGNTKKFEVDNVYKYYGADVSEYISGEKKSDNIFQDVFDDIKDSFKLTDKDVNYSTKLNSKINFLTEYKFHDKFSFVYYLSHHFLDNYSITENNFNVTFSQKNISFLLNYGLKSKLGNYLGAGINLNFKNIQFYAASSTLNAIWSPGKVKAVNMQLGINYFINIKKKNDKEGLKSMRGW